MSLSPSASPSGSVDEQALIDEAVAALTEYLALANEVENNGGHGWEEKLKPWWGSESMMTSGTSHFTTLIDNGWRTEGSGRITEIDRAELVKEEGTVQIEYCLDGTQVRALDENGQEFAEVPTHPFPAHAEMRREESRWLVLSIRTDWETAC